MGHDRTSAMAPKYASTIPTPLAATDNSSDSVKTCRTIRPRPAPSATRTAISRRRDIARASSRPAIFVQAISRRRATIAIRASSDCANTSRSMENPAAAGSTSRSVRSHCGSLLDVASALTLI